MYCGDPDPKHTWNTCSLRPPGKPCRYCGNTDRNHRWNTCEHRPPADNMGNPAQPAIQHQPQQQQWQQQPVQRPQPPANPPQQLQYHGPSQQQPQHPHLAPPQQQHYQPPPQQPQPPPQYQNVQGHQGQMPVYQQGYNYPPNMISYPYPINANPTGTFHQKFELRCDPPPTGQQYRPQPQPQPQQHHQQLQQPQQRRLGACPTCNETFTHNWENCRTALNYQG
jgi:hypothetical protein